MNRITTGIIISLLTVAAALAWTTEHYYHNAIKYKGQRNTATQRLQLANAEMTDMQARQRDVAMLDAKYTRELADAKAENDTLRAAVVAGRKQLHINATCPGTVREATGTGSLGDAETIQFDRTVEQDYFRLREMIVSNEKQILYLQNYIRDVLHDQNTD